MTEFLEFDLNRVFIREPKLEDEKSFITAMVRSQDLHYPWVRSPQTSQEFKDYLNRYQQDNQRSYLVLDGLGNITGVFNISEIVRGFFQNAYLGFYAVADYVGQGYMSAGLKLVLQKAFCDMQLHRIEVNIQPENISSINLVKSNRFRKEGYSPRYLKINDEWRDHERWAMTIEDWQQPILLGNIETENLLLRRPTAEDALILSDLWKDEKIREFLGGVISKKMIDDKIHSLQIHWSQHGFGQWTVLDKKSNQVIGLCGLHHSADGIELSYMFFPTSWGRGLAREAAQASIEFGFNILKLDRIIAITQAANTRSCSLLEKIGMNHIDNFRRYDANQCLYEVLDQPF